MLKMTLRDALHIQATQALWYVGHNPAAVLRTLNANYLPPIYSLDERLDVWIVNRYIPRGGSFEFAFHLKDQPLFPRNK